jgi:hypothetical protein
MKTFLAVYTGTPEGLARWKDLDEATRKSREASGMKAWIDWGAANAAVTLFQGGPLGKTKQVSPDGIADIRNNMAGFTVIQAESHEAAARLFLNHPHFAIFPGDAVEIMECLPIPSM